MQNKQQHRRQKPNLGDLQAFFASLQRYKPHHQGPYTFEDRYRDFREVFDSEAGKRVLSQIIDLAEGIPVSLNQLENHAFLSYRVGMREVGLWLVKTMNEIPRDHGEKTDE